MVIHKISNPAENIRKQLRTSKTAKIIRYHPENNWGPIIDNLVQFEEDLNNRTKKWVVVRAQWDRCWGPKSSKIETGHLFSIVKLNFNVGLFSCIFWFQAIFLSQSAIFCRSKFGIFAHFVRFFYNFIIADLELKIFVFKCQPQQQSWKAYKGGKFCQKDQTPISLCSKIRNRAIIIFHLALKWQKAANGKFGKFGSF